MPAPNDLTPEEEALFTAQGVAPAGQGQEPTGEPNQEARPEPAAAPVHADRTAQPRGPDGKFTPAAPEAPADPVAPPPADASAPAAPPPGFVPHAALHEARTREAEARRQFQLLQTRTNAMLASRQPEAPAPLPSLDDDPVGYITGLEQRLAAFERQSQEADRFRQIDDALRSDEATFASYTPDYEQASEHYVNSRAKELLAFYSPQEAQQIMMNEARQLAQNAWQRGVPAAQIIYQMAQARGYTAGAAPAPAAAPTPVPAAGLTPAERVAHINNGQQQTRSLSAATGAAGAAALNAEALLAMSDEEFDSYLKLNEKGANKRFAAIGGA